MTATDDPKAPGLFDGKFSPTRPLAASETGPVSVRLCGPVGSWAAPALAAKNPVVMVIALETSRSAPSGIRIGGALELFMITVPIPNGPEVNDEPGRALEPAPRKAVTADEPFPVRVVVPL